MAAVELRGCRPLPTPREHVRTAVAQAATQCALERSKHPVPVAQGTLSFWSFNEATDLRVALRNPRGQRTLLATVYGVAPGFYVTRTLAEALRRAPADTGYPAGTAPRIDPVAVAARMRFWRGTGLPRLRKNATVRLKVRSAEVVVGRSGVEVISPSRYLNVSLEGPWQAIAVARLADAMVRDLVPEARHLTHTTEPRGYYRNESGSLLYDGSSWAVCTCGWRYAGERRDGARAAAAWHREHPSQCHWEQDPA